MDEGWDQLHGTRFGGCAIRTTLIKGIPSAMINTPDHSICAHKLSRQSPSTQPTSERKKVRITTKMTGTVLQGN